jgi:hypothetical protein
MSGWRRGRGRWRRTSEMQRGQEKGHVIIEKSLHQKVRIAAAIQDITTQDFVAKTIREYFINHLVLNDAVVNAQNLRGDQKNAKRTTGVG